MADDRPPVLRVWIDAQLPPAMAAWLATDASVEAQHTFSLGLLGASDQQIWDAARIARAVIVSKDIDFVDMVRRLGAPPQVVWVTAGNITNAALRDLIGKTWPRAVELLKAGEPLIELRGQ